MLQDLVLAEAAVMSMGVMARESTGEEPPQPPQPTSTEKKRDKGTPLNEEAPLNPLSLTPSIEETPPEVGGEQDEGWSNSFDIADAMDLSNEESSENIVTNR